MTAGATQALLTAILCAVHPGEEVIVVEPTYDSYLPSIELAGGKPVFVTLEAPDAFALAYAGEVELAKQFGTYRLYSLRKRIKRDVV